MKCELNNFMYKFFIFFISLVLTSCAALDSVSSNIANTVTNTKEIQVDPDDPCGAHRTALGASRNFYLKNIISGAIVGAAVGGLAAAVTGGGGKSIATGAALGGLVGGGAGYLNAQQQEQAEAQKLINELGDEVAKEYQQIDKATQGFIALRDCRFSEARAVRDNYRAKRLSREDAQRRLNRLSELFNQDVAIAEEIGVKMSERAKTYTEKSEALLRDDPVAKASYDEWVNQQETQPEKTKYKAKAKAKGKSQTVYAKSKTVAKKADTNLDKKFSIAKQTHSNNQKQVNFNQEIAKSKALASKEFSLDGQISLDFSPVPFWLDA